MLLIGVDYHPSFQQIAFFEEETGECGVRLLRMQLTSDGDSTQVPGLTFAIHVAGIRDFFLDSFASSH